MATLGVRADHRDSADELTLVEEKVGAQPAPAQPPDQTDRFVDLEPRGEGAHASVWKARDTKLDRIVALRIVRLSAGGDEKPSRTPGRWRSPHSIRTS